MQGEIKDECRAKNTVCKLISTINVYMMSVWNNLGVVKGQSAVGILSNKLLGSLPAYFTASVVASFLIFRSNMCTQHFFFLYPIQCTTAVSSSYPPVDSVSPSVCLSVCILSPTLYTVASLNNCMIITVHTPHTAPSFHTHSHASTHCNHAHTTDLLAYPFPTTFL